MEKETVMTMSMMMIATILTSLVAPMLDASDRLSGSDFQEYTEKSLILQKCQQLNFITQ